MMFGLIIRCLVSILDLDRSSSLKVLKYESDRCVPIEDQNRENVV